MTSEPLTKAGSRAERIETLLRAAFSPCELEIEDDSHRHAGHAGNPDGGGETHYRLRLVSSAFQGQNRVARSRAVHEALAEEFATGLHALSLKLQAPGEPP